MTMGEVIVPVLRYTPRPGDRHSRPPHSRARRPEPRCPSYAARVTVSGTNDPGGNRNGTRARREQVAWDRRVRRFRQAGDVRHAAAQYHDVGVEHVDQRREGAAETIVVSGQGRCRTRVAARRGAYDLAAGQRATRMLGVIALERGAGEPGFDAAVLSAVTGRTGPFVGPEPGKRIVPPFPGDEVRAQKDAAVHDDPTADPGAEDDAEHDVRAGGRTVGGLGEGETVRVVHEPH